MSIQNALVFLKDASINESFREMLYKIEAKNLMPYLESMGYKFTLQEFEEMVNSEHVKCQTVEEANQLMEMVRWFMFLLS